MIIEFRKRPTSGMVAPSPASGAVERRSSTLSRPTPVAVPGGAWYHEAAIAEAERAPPRPH